MKASEHFGKKLRELRKSKKLTAGELSSYLHCSPSLIYNIERGLNRPQPELIVDTANFFGVSTDYLLRDEVIEEEENLVEVYRQLNNVKKISLFYLLKILSGYE
jgi:transcriptional regulator with XRE-family HTH domain